MKTLDLVQGSPEWKAHRATHFNASDAPAMMACSPYKTRTELLQELKFGLSAEVDAATQRRFDNGHRFEALARPLAEEIIGERLYPVTGVEGELSASFDGLTMSEDTAFEHKSLNDSLRYNWDEGNGYHLPKHYQVQMEQQLLVSGAERVLFMASKWDGDTLVEERHCWYASDPKLREELIAGWKQFAADLASYAPAEIKERPAAEVTLALPALVIHAKGEITTSNMKEYGEALKKRLAEVRAIVLSNDQDFSNAKEAAKRLRENITQAQYAKKAMLDQTVTVGEASDMIDAWCEDMRVTALQLEKDVEREDRIKKAAMIAKARDAYEQHIEALKADTGGPWIILPAPNWPEAIKGKRNFVSMQGALDDMLAAAKIVADESARKIRASLACMAEEGKGYEFLLSDRLAHIGKPSEDVRTLVRARITEHKAAEERRAAELAERERARIAAEERAKAEAEVRAEQQRKQAEERAAAQAQAALAQAAAPAPVAAPTPAPVAAPVSAPAARTVAAPAPALARSGETIKLGQICERLGITVTAGFLASIGVESTGRDRSAVLFPAEDFPAICDALIAHIEDVREAQTAGAPF